MTGQSSYSQKVPIVLDLNIQAYLLIQGLDLVDAFASASGTRLCSCFMFGCFGMIKKFRSMFLNLLRNNKLINLCAKLQA